MSSKMTLLPHSQNPIKKGPAPVNSAKFEASVSPESFKHKMNIGFNEDNVANSAVDTFQFKGYGSETCSFKIMIDGTGKTETPESPGNTISSNAVKDQIDKLTNAVYKYQGSIHKAYYVEVIWGSYNFYGNCNSFDIDYILFNNQGTPLLAEISLSFMILRDPGNATKVGQTSSPDMTHVHTFREGDKLPNMCNDIYDSPNYYIQIAKLNNLSNFRNIKPGTQIVFPPLVNREDG